MSQPALPRKSDMSLALKDVAVPSPKPQSLFKAGAIMPLQKPEDFGRSQLMELDQTAASPATATAADVSLRIQTAEMENFSSYVRLEYASHNTEQLKKVVPRFAAAEIPLSRSFVRRKMHIISDAALFHNRQSRVGWGPDLQLLDILHSSRLSFETVNTSDFRLPIADRSEDAQLFTADSKNPYVALLMTYLKHVRRVVVGEVPTLRPAPGSGAVASLKTTTEALISRVKSKGDPKTLDLLNYMLKVWKLCLALWAPLEVDSGSHAETMARKEALTHWLEDTAIETPVTGLEEEEEVIFVIFLNL